MLDVMVAVEATMLIVGLVGGFFAFLMWYHVNVFTPRTRKMRQRKRRQAWAEAQRHARPFLPSSSTSETPSSSYSSASSSGTAKVAEGTVVKGAKTCDDDSISMGPSEAQNLSSVLSDDVHNQMMCVSIRALHDDFLFNVSPSTHGAHGAKVCDL